MARFVSNSARHLAWSLTLALGGVAAADENLLDKLIAPPIPPTPASPATAPAEIEADDTEVIQERYPNRNVKVERHVAQDADGNYANHGRWSMWDENGRLMCRGQYEHGVREGKWVRFFKAGEAEVLSGPLGKTFSAPFNSTVTLTHGELNGAWTIVDSRDRPVISWQLEDGQRHGKSVWWFPNGQKWREMDYSHGDLDGFLVEWDASGKLVAKEQYVEGHRCGVQIEWYSPGVKKVEAQYIFARDVTQINDDWFNGTSRIKVLGKEGKDERHGHWTTFYSNGQKAMQGEYEFDKSSGEFIWWHPNGQKAIVGEYTDGKQSGHWAWWHANGQKHIRGKYESGRQSGAWTWWTEDGKVAEAAAFNEEGGRVAVDRQLETVDKPPELQTPSDAQVPVDESAQTEDASSTTESTTAAPGPVTALPATVPAVTSPEPVDSAPELTQPPTLVESSSVPEAAPTTEPATVKKNEPAPPAPRRAARLAPPRKS